MSVDKYWHTPKAIKPPLFDEREEKKKRFPIAVGLDPYEQETIPDDFHVIEMPDMWVSDALDELLGQFCPHQAICLHAPTGLGKTTLVGKILKYLPPGKKALLLVPRTAIAAQQKRILCKARNSKWKNVQDPLAFRYNDEYDDIGLTVMTYQKFASKYRKMDLSRYEWVICDEAHFWYTDVLFNPYADSLLTKIPELFARAKRLYLSATPGPVLEDIARAERNSSLSCCGSCRSCWRPTCDRILLYHFPERLGRINLFYYQEIDEIVALACRNPEDKLLIFVSAREGEARSPAASYVKKLEASKISVEYLDRFEKESETWRKLCEESTFKSQALVCTSVLDCGANVHDDRLRHVVVETTDRTEFLQMVGRKRLKPGENINVYIRAISEDSINAKLRSVNEWLQIIKDCEHANSENDFFSLLWRGWMDESPNRPYMHLLYPLSDGRLKVRPTAHHALLWQQATLKNLKRDFMKYDIATLPRLAHSWLKSPGGYSESNWISNQLMPAAQQDLTSFLRNHADVEISAVEWPPILQQLRLLIGHLIKKQHDDKRELGHKALNDRLSELNFYYKIVPGANGSYTIRHLGEMKA